MRKGIALFGHCANDWQAAPRVQKRAASVGTGLTPPFWRSAHAPRPLKTGRRPCNRSGAVFWHCANDWQAAPRVQKRAASVGTGLTPPFWRSAHAPRPLTPRPLKTGRRPCNRSGAVFWHCANDWQAAPRVQKRAASVGTGLTPPFWRSAHAPRPLKTGRRPCNRSGAVFWHCANDWQAAPRVQKRAASVGTGLTPPFWRSAHAPRPLTPRPLKTGRRPCNRSGAVFWHCANDWQAAPRVQKRAASVGTGLTPPFWRSAHAPRPLKTGRRPCNRSGAVFWPLSYPDSHLRRCCRNHGTCCHCRRSWNTHDIHAMSDLRMHDERRLLVAWVLVFRCNRPCNLQQTLTTFRSLFMLVFCFFLLCQFICGDLCARRRTLIPTSSFVRAFQPPL